MIEYDDYIEEEAECEPSPGRWRYRLLAVFFMLLGLCFFAILALGVSYLLNQFWGGRTWEMAVMAIFCGTVGSLLVIIGLRLYIRAPVSDAIRMEALKTACLWNMARREQSLEEGE